MIFISVTLGKIVLCFSAVTNGEKILRVGNTRTDIRCVHGIRVLSMWWVILGHVYVFSISAIGKTTELGM
jgi:hypothetical protein